MTQEEIEHMWKVASNNPNHDTNWHDPVVIAFAKLVAAKERERIIEANAPELEKANAHIKRLEEHAYDLVGELRVANIKLSMRPPRTWVGLTDEEVESYWDWEDFQCGCGRGTLLEMVRDIEAALKERNT
jgi:hypothetical protein